ncbi:TIGR03435 family protein [Terriglobus sp. RCC_193]|uniref:TIGR03435 family protein n=1 Tax=Terriglobus sp. RCC_193 TaxID=3239218 RepID=UPI0035258097
MAVNCFARLRSVVFQSLFISGYVFFVVPFALSQGAGPAVPGNATYSPKMTFDVASVRESHPDPVKGFVVGGAFAGRTSVLSLSNERIASLIVRAYNLSSDQISGLPTWAGSAMYNVEAKSDAETDRTLATLTDEQLALERQHMLQALLAERFNLKTHWSTTEQGVYHLVVVKGGPKVRAGGSVPSTDDEVKRFGGNKIPEIYQLGDGLNGYEYFGRNCHIASLARVLGRLMGTDVIDRTGLSGTYDFEFRYSQASDAEREKEPNMYPPIPEAVKGQLGLKLEPAKGSVRELVVDHIDKSSAN